ncbi:MAG TPA: HlyD family efflux transporter periplasmic adaptor subunit [Bacteroidia bacterium]|nr:HlyD family efflux transporter periplasmic adaptor subunit [Bacteroidia bacterium]
MKKQIQIACIAWALLNTAACTREKGPDASGVFEAVETIISAESQGRLLSFSLREGDLLQAGQLVGFIDSNQLYLNKLQLLQQQKAILSAKPSVQVQLEALRAELKVAEQDRTRIKNLVGGDVASQKQLDDANARIEVIQSRIAAQESALNTTSSNLNEQAATVNVQLEQVNLALSKCRLVNPIKGTVLLKYAETNELCLPGKALYKVADLDELVLRCYLSADQLNRVKLGQEVKVITDGVQGQNPEYKGKITWISDKGEFTPKTIQTRNERANTVYAIKVNVKNDGKLKLGMYAEIQF